MIWLWLCIAMSCISAAAAANCIILVASARRWPPRCVSGKVGVNPATDRPPPAQPPDDD